MSNSSLVTYTRLSPNRTSPRNHKIDTVTIHCYVGEVTAERGCSGSRFTRYNPLSGASCNYVVGYDGSIGLCVEEKDRSWCSSNKANDHRAITIEVASETKAPYKVTDEAMEALIKLLVDICHRNDIEQLLWQGDKNLIGQVDKQNMTVHRWFKNKACPGEYLYDRHTEIAAEVNRRLGINTEMEENTADKKPYRVRVIASCLNIRAGAGVNHAKRGEIRGCGIYTIIETRSGQGSKSGWGRLKSGAGWISLDYTEKI